MEAVSLQIITRTAQYIYYILALLVSLIVIVSCLIPTGETVLEFAESMAVSSRKRLID